MEIGLIIHYLLQHNFVHIDYMEAKIEVRQKGVAARGITLQYAI